MWEESHLESHVQYELIRLSLSGQTGFQINKPCLGSTSKQE